MQESINRPSMLKIGTILRGIYRIDSYLSSGGFGNTYIATNIEFEERVAIKEFFMKGVTQRDDNQTTVSVSNSDNHDSFLAQKEKFKKEARRIRQLKNEYIVAVHDLFEENGTAYYVMDYVDGENLAERLKRTGKPMTEKEVRDIVPQILNALKSVHDAGIWHLDLKPANIMVDKFGNVKLIDFGASKQLNAQKGGATTSTAISYTNGYAPREQMEQNYDKFGPWTDIYALGATLYNLLTNKRPPLPTDIDDDISDDKHLSLPFPDDVSDEMKQIVLWMMKTNRNQRPQKVDDIISLSSNLETTDVDEETIIALPPKEETAEKDFVDKGKTNNHNIGNAKSENNKKAGSKTKYWLVIIPAIILLGGLTYLVTNKGDSRQIPEIALPNDSIEEIIEVKDMDFDSPLGACKYNGPIDNYNRPDGIGEAYFADGRYYKGPFSGGNLTGENAYFKYPNGDSFKGEFKNNSFFWGVYTIAEDGSYFKGSFVNGQPDKGGWHDKNGKTIQ